MKVVLHSIDEFVAGAAETLLNQRLEYLTGLCPDPHASPAEKVAAELELCKANRQLKICRTALQEARKTGGYFVSLYTQMLNGEYQPNGTIPADCSGKD